MAVAASMVPLQPLLGGKESLAEASVAGYDSAARAAASFNYRTTTAQADNINIGVLPDNGDATDADSLDINGELLKLAFNISTGHGIHAGIHFRSSINASVLR